MPDEIRKGPTSRPHAAQSGGLLVLGGLAGLVVVGTVAMLSLERDIAAVGYGVLALAAAALQPWLGTGMRIAGSSGAGPSRSLARLPVQSVARDT